MIIWVHTLPNKHTSCLCIFQKKNLHTALATIYVVIFLENITLIYGYHSRAGYDGKSVVVTYTALYACHYNPQLI